MKSKPGSSISNSNPLADLLVKEFRICQDLHYLIREERRAVLNRDQRLVAALLSQKKHLLEELSLVEGSVQSKIEEIGLALAAKDPLIVPRTTAKILAEYDRETSGRHCSLYEGIQALQEIISAMDSVNQTLALPVSSTEPQYLP